ncbi:MAG: YidB family protein [Acidobacteriaceae bacterium]
MSIFDAAKGLLDSNMVKNMVASECNEHPGLVSHAVEMVNDPAVGGLDGLMQKFRSNGLGEAVNSWIGPGGNHPITGDQVQQVLGQDRINAIASKFGMSSEDASAKLAQVLPSIVDKLTPGGSVGSAQS